MRVRVVIGLRRGGGEEVLLAAPDGRAAHGGVDFRVDRRQLVLERGYRPGVALADALDLGAPLAIAFGDNHLDDLPPPSDEVGGHDSDRVAGTKPAIIAASIGSVLAHWPIAWAECWTWAGLSAGSAATTIVWKPPVAAMAIRSTASPFARSINSATPLPSRATEQTESHLRSLPSLRKRAPAEQVTIEID